MIKNYFIVVFLFVLMNSLNAQTTAIPDANFEQALIDSGIDSDATVNGSVATSDISGVTVLNLEDKSISDLTGIQDFISLTNLNLRDNQLTSLDLSNNLNMAVLDCFDNKITGLDLSNNKVLTNLICADNKLTSLNLRNTANSMLISMTAVNNTSLTCIQVDNETDANAGTGSYVDWLKDTIATYANDCGYVLGVEDQLLAEGLILFPNPVSNMLSIESKLPIEKVEIYSILGGKVKELNTNFKSINLDDISRGVYLIRIYSEKGNLVRKLIKN